MAEPALDRTYRPRSAGGVTSPLRVLHLQGAGERAGAEVALLNRVRHLSEHGVESIVAFLAQGPFVQELEEAGVRTLVLSEAPPRVRYPWRFPGAVLAVAKAAREHEIDVIEGVSEKMSIFAGWAARLSRTACVYSLHDAPNRDRRSQLVQLLAMTGRHDLALVPSRWMAEAFWRSWRLRCEVVPNALDASAFSEPSADQGALTGEARGGLSVGLFGRLVQWKGQEVLLKAAGLLRNEEDLRYLIVGGTLYGREQDFASRLHRLAQTLNVDERVVFAGHRDDAKELMAGCDIICHCSLEPEPFGVVVIEGMALGKPVIATLTGGPEEILEDEVTGLLVPPDDERALAGALLRLAKDPDLRRGLGSRARDAALVAFDARSLADRQASLYRLAAKRRGGRGRLSPSG